MKSNNNVSNMAAVVADATPFADFGFTEEILQAINKAGFTTPTPIQTKAIPEVLAGKDMFGFAQTGTGKTAAFALPIISKLVSGPKTNGARALVLVPTRELAHQVHKVFRQFAPALKVIEIYGGMKFGKQFADLRSRPDVIVACPGRLFDHIERGSAILSNVQHLVLDEADQMADMGFLPTVTRIIKTLPAKRQTLLFSATDSRELKKLSHDILSHPITVDTREKAAAEFVEHAIYEVSQKQKPALLHTILNSIAAQSVLIFTRTRDRAKKVATFIGKKGFAATSIQGNLSQAQRQRAMDGFRKGKYQVLVATDVAARGIDISTVSHVINFDIPATVDAYVHRIGRTGRANRTGDALTFASSEDRSIVFAIEKRIAQRIKRIPLPKLIQSEDTNTNATESPPVDIHAVALEHGGSHRIARGNRADSSRDRRGGRHNNRGERRYEGKHENDDKREHRRRPYTPRGVSSVTDRHDQTQLPLAADSRPSRASSHSYRSARDRNSSGSDDRRGYDSRRERGSRPEGGRRFGQRDSGNRGRGREDRFAGRSHRSSTKRPYTKSSTKTGSGQRQTSLTWDDNKEG